MKIKITFRKIKCANYQSKYFHVARKVVQIICINEIFSMTKFIQKYIVIWYHTCLLHPRMYHTEATISQHYYWYNLRDEVSTYIKFC